MQSQWKPIDTVPKDGSVIKALLWAEVKSDLPWSGVHYYKTWVIGEYDADFDEWVMHFSARNPTHWMPLPDTPEETE